MENLDSDFGNIDSEGYGKGLACGEGCCLDPDPILDAKGGTWVNGAGYGSPHNYCDGDGDWDKTGYTPGSAHVSYASSTSCDGYGASIDIINGMGYGGGSAEGGGDSYGYGYDHNYGYKS